MTQLIINADDFGYSTGINLGIIHAHQRGILTSTTIMAGMPGFKEAVELAKANSELGVGVHLTLTCGSPVREDVPTLTNEEGSFHDLSFYEKEFSVDLDELYNEWKTQIEWVIDSGIKPTHLDSHHHVNVIDPITTVFIKLAEEFDLPVRNNFEVPEELSTTESFVTYFDSVGHNKEIWRAMEMKNLLQTLQQNTSTEIMCHPAYVDKFLLENSSFNVGRTIVLDELLDPTYPEILEENNIHLIHFGELKNKRG